MNLHLLKRQIVSDGLWVLLGQVSAALGTLVGIRMLTEVLPPEVFGATALFVGLVALAVGIFCTPVMQATQRYYPEYAAASRVAILRGAIIPFLLKNTAIGVGLLVLIGGVYGAFYGLDLIILALMAGLILTETARTMESAFLNAARRQKVFAIWTGVEAWVKPVAAVGIIYLFGRNAGSVLFGYLAASFVILLIVLIFIQREGVPEGARRYGVNSNLNQQLKNYTYPLMPVAFVAWVSGQGDRYVIAAMLGLEQVGVYAAMYGLVSRPFLMIGQVVELTLRPIYQAAVSSNNEARTRRIFNYWLVLLTVALGAGFLVVLIWHEEIAYFLVGKEYRSGSYIMSWIAGGYCLLVLSYVYERVCYAYGRTRLVLLIQISGGASSLVIIFVAVKYWGMLGAAVAVPMYFGIQLLVAYWVARGVRHSSTKDKLQDTAGWKSG